MAEQKHFILGIREQGGREYPFGLTSNDLAQHLYVVGKSGGGKSALIKNLALQLIEAGYGVAYLDPHGDDAQELLDYLPKRLVEKLIYFNSADRENPIAFNVLKGDAAPDLLASGIVGTLKGIWEDSWGSRLEYVLGNAVAALLECENVSFLSIQRILSDAQYRQWVLRQVDDPVIQAYWEGEFANYERKFLQEVVSPIQNKVGKILLSPTLRNIVGQVRSQIDARFIMDDSRIFIANLSKGMIGDDRADLLGAFLITQFKLAAMSRANVPKEKRPPFYLFVDEFQSFKSKAFISILSEARKYNLRLVLANQFLDQIDKEIRDAIFGNVGSVISFRVGQDDADLLSKEFGNVFPPSRFTQLDNYQVLVKQLINGTYYEPFHGTTILSSAKRYGHAETFVHRSREKYSTKRKVVDDRIRRWFN